MTFRHSSIFTRLAALAAIVVAVAGSMGREAQAFTTTQNGYVCVDSEETTGFPPQFAWDDISLTGLIQNAGNNENIGSFVNPNPFIWSLFGIQQTIIGMNSNGYLVPGGAVPNVDNNLPIPNAGAPNGIICGFWDNLSPQINPNNVRSQTLGVAPQRRTVIQWTNIPSNAAVGVFTVTFQFTLFEEGGATAVRIQYQTMTGPGAQGTGATVGIENNVGQLGVQYEADGLPATNNTYNNLAIGFYTAGATPPWPVVPPPPPQGGAGANGPGSSSVDDGNKSDENGDTDWKRFRHAACSSSSAAAGTFLVLACAAALLAALGRRA